MTAEMNATTGFANSSSTPNTAASTNTNTTASTTLSTRVCIKNIPIGYDEQQLQAFLIKESKLPLLITDVKILRRKSDSKSRQLAFLGFRSQEQATHVVQHFHKTYCRTSRMSVEYALAKNHTTEEHRPWSKHSKGSTKYEQLHGVKKSTVDEHDDEHDNVNVTVVSDEQQQQPVPLTKEERRKQEFMAAMGVGKDKTKFWANDDGAMGMDIAVPAASVAAVASAAAALDKKKNKKDDGGVLGQALKDDVKHDADDDDNVSSSDKNEDDESAVASDDSGGEGANMLKSTTKKRVTAGAVVTDLDFLRSKATDKDELESDNDDDDGGEEVAMKDDASVGSSSSSSWPSEDSSDEDSDDDDDDDAVKKDKTVAVVTTTTETQKAVATTKPVADTDDQEDDMELTKDDQQDSIAHDRVFVRNLPFATMEEDLRQHFESFGAVSECHIPVDDQKRNKGFAFVAFVSRDAAARAMDGLDGTDFQGRLLHILPARKSTNIDLMDPNDPSLTYKQKQDLLRRQNAMDSTKQQGWSASFVRGDAVVDNLAQRLGLRKGDILDVKGLSSGDAAVRLALGETQIIEENRQYFANHGVDMEALVSTSTKTATDKKVAEKGELKRSTTSILVKNLPFETEKDDLQKLFGDAPERILLPPSRTIALVEYSHSGDAKRAFKKLAYKRFKHVPLYLEWAPLASKIDTTTSTGVGGAGSTTPSGESTVQEQQQATTLAQERQEMEREDAADPNVSFSIYVKNLNFATSEDQLRDTFKKHVTVRAVKIPLKAAPIRRGEEQSTKFLAMGFGFVECDSDASVRKALKVLQGTVLDGHALELKRSSKPLVGSGGSDKTIKTPKAPKGKNPTKIMCRNVPFQATRKEILQLFGSFGQLKKVRLPRKFDGQHRGFAFCEFLTTQEAQAAMTALSRTHLYGRHLVLEWADDKEDMDLLREKAKRDMASDKSKSKQPLNKKIKFNFD
jgi:multiple RNA-binding domain-containing protein 1